MTIRKLIHHANRRPRRIPALKALGSVAALGFACAALSASADEEIVRKELLTAQIGQRNVSKVDVKEINFKPLQRSPPHRHPCPVVSYIASGSVQFQIQGQPAQTLKTGSIVFEPADTPIEHFDNPSKTQPLKFIAYYLLKGDEKTLIEMLPAK